MEGCISIFPKGKRCYRSDEWYKKLNTIDRQNYRVYLEIGAILPGQT